MNEFPLRALIHLKSCAMPDVVLQVVDFYAIADFLWAMRGRPPGVAVLRSVTPVRIRYRPL
jgi:hypothetical protein